LLPPQQPAIGTISIAATISILFMLDLLPFAAVPDHLPSNSTPQNARGKLRRCFFSTYEAISPVAVLNTSYILLSPPWKTLPIG
jgi:hypothetical protein